MMILDAFSRDESGQVQTIVNQLDHLPHCPMAQEQKAWRAALQEAQPALDAFVPPAPVTSR